MKTKSWILTGVACLICLGAGTGLGLLLGQNNHSPAEPALLGQGNPIPAGTEAPVLLGGIGSVGGATSTGAPAVSTQADSLLAKLAGLADDFNVLTAQAQQEATVRDEWLALYESMRKAYPGKADEGMPVPSSLSAACEKLGVKVSYVSGNMLNYNGWYKAMTDITGGIKAAHEKLEQTVATLKSKRAQYEQTIYELHNVEKNADPGARITYTDMTQLMRIVIAWAEEQVEAG